MKPPRFNFSAPHSLEEAFAILAASEAPRVLAGGQSLLPMLNARSLMPDMLVDIQHLPSLRDITIGDDAIAVGAMVRQRDCEGHQTVCRRNPLLPAVLQHVAHTAIRNRGTVVGSLCHAAANAELPLLLILLDGGVVAQSGRGSRLIPARELFVADGKTSVNPDEIVTAARFPMLQPRSGWAFNEVCRRLNDPALCAVGAVVRRDHDGRAVEVRLAAGGIAATPVRLAAAEQLLHGTWLDQPAVAAACRAAAASVTIGDDLRASTAYRRSVLAVLIMRSVAQAAARCSREEG
ncbi:FAD binding domain-containing protein [Paraherbaspirillum soli]|uniref:FAD binding domain-containing protein n=1 Tax=Paraherbaspirillum soli TaxID=631222 RepID=A0ABW0MCP6_9BURK